MTTLILAKSRTCLCYFSCEIILLVMRKCFYAPLSPHRSPARLELLHMNQLHGPMHSSITCSMPFLMPLKSRIHIARIARVITSIITKKQIDVVRCRFLSSIAYRVGFFLSHTSSFPPRYPLNRSLRTAKYRLQ